MVEYKKVNVKLSDTQLKNLKISVKNKTETTLRKSLKMFNWNKLLTTWIIINNTTKNKTKKCL